MPIILNTMSNLQILLLARIPKKPNGERYSYIRHVKLLQLFVKEKIVQQEFEGNRCERRL